MSIFKRKTKQQNSVESKEIVYPEYHNCPICNERIKTIPNVIGEYTEVYLDGQRKIPFDVYMGCYHRCPKCGYVYIHYDYGDTFKTHKAVIDVVNSEKYQNIRNDDTIKEPLKTLQLMQLISECNTVEICNMNDIWLMYYYEQKDEENVNKHLLVKVEEVKNGNYYAIKASPSKLPFHCKQTLHFLSNDILTDIYRRIGLFDKAKEYIQYAYNNYNFTYSDGKKLYYEYQEKLISEGNKSHI